MKFKNGILVGDDGATAYMCPFEGAVMIPPNFRGQQPKMKKMFPCNQNCDLSFELLKNKNGDGIDWVRLHCLKREFALTPEPKVTA